MDMKRLIYNAPLEYAQLVLGGGLEEYLNGTPEHRLMVSAQQPPVYKTCRPATKGLHVSRDTYSHKHQNSSCQIPAGYRVPTA